MTYDHNPKFDNVGMIPSEKYMPNVNRNLEKEKKKKKKHLKKKKDSHHTESEESDIPLATHVVNTDAGEMPEVSTWLC